MLDGNLVPKTTINCEKKAGCRAIQKTGECCPEYQCGKYEFFSSFPTY
jgi:hypothetical protein